MDKSGILANVSHEMKRTSMYVLGLSEARWKEGGELTSEGFKVICARGEENQKGVALLLDEEVAKCVVSTEAF